MSFRKKKNSMAMTIVELIVYAFLLGLLLTAIYGIFTSCLQYYRLGEIRSDLHGNAIRAMSNIFRDVACASKSSLVTSSSSPKGLYFASSKKSDGTFEFDSSGEMLWQKWSAYYLKSDGNNHYNLVKKEKAIATPSATPGTFPYASFTAFVNDSSLPERVIARNVSNLFISLNSDGNYDFTFTFDRTTDPTKPNTLEVKTEIMVRN